jgi:SP family myo-inositol transporter-like MFS transporter 13
MVGGGEDNTDFLECFRITWKTPYILRLAATAGIGGLLFGYDTGTVHPLLLFSYIYIYIYG